MTYLLGSLRRERERYNVFNAIGLLAVAVKQDIKPYIPKIMEVIRTSLPAKDLTIRYVYTFNLYSRLIKSANLLTNCQILLFFFSQGT